MTVTWVRIESAWILLWFVAGRFSLSRIGLGFVDIRLAILVGGLILLTGREQRSNAPSTHSARRLLGLFYLLLFIQMASLFLTDFTLQNRAILYDQLLLFGFLVVTSRLEVVRRAEFEDLVGGILLVAAIYFVGGALASNGSLTNRWNAFGGGSNVFGRIMGLGVISAVAFSVFRSNVRYRVAIAPLSIGLLASQSRGAVFAIGIVSLALALILIAKKSVRPALQVLIVGAAAIIAVRQFAPAGYERFLFRFLSTTSRESGVETRGAIFSEAVDAWAANPLLGIGLGDFGNYSDIGGETFTTHNYLLASAAETGTIGLFVVLILYASMTLSLARSIRSNLATQDIFLGSAWLFLAVASLFSGGYYDARGVWLFAMLALASREAIARKASNRRQATAESSA